jgi:uncharacterized protein with HEPN domain
LSNFITHEATLDIRAYLGYYFYLNTEAIYNICQENIDELAQTIKMMIKDLS